MVCRKMEIIQRMNHTYSIQHDVKEMRQRRKYIFLRLKKIEKRQIWPFLLAQRDNNTRLARQDTGDIGLTERLLLVHTDHDQCNSSED